MRKPAFRVRTLLIAVGTLALLLGAGLEIARFRRLSTKYRYVAWSMGNDVQSALGNLTRAEARLQQLRSASGSLSDDERAERIELEVGVERLRAKVAASANLVALFEHAASHPWEEPPDVAYPDEVVRSYPIVQRFVTAAPAPQPPVPPEFTPQPGPPSLTPAPPPPPRPTGE